MKTLGKVDRGTPWVVKTEIHGYAVKRIDADGRRISVYDNWMTLTEEQAKAICHALNVLLETPALSCSVGGQTGVGMSGEG